MSETKGWIGKGILLINSTMVLKIRARDGNTLFSLDFEEELSSFNFFFVILINFALLTTEVPMSFMQDSFTFSVQNF